MVIVFNYISCSSKICQRYIQYISLHYRFSASLRSMSLKTLFLKTGRMGTATKLSSRVKFPCWVNGHRYRHRNSTRRLSVVDDNRSSSPVPHRTLAGKFMHLKVLGPVVWNNSQVISINDQVTFLFHAKFSLKQK